jgi:hypothetical protein
MSQTGLTVRSNEHAAVTNALTSTHTLSVTSYITAPTRKIMQYYKKIMGITHFFPAFAIMNEYNH